MDTIGMDSYPFIAAAAAAVIVVPEQDRVLLVGRRKGNPFPERQFFGPPEAGKRRLNRPLAHGCSPRDNQASRIGYFSQTRWKSPWGRTRVQPANHRLTTV